MGSIFLEIAKIVFPAMIVAIVVYFVLREMLVRQLQIQQQKAHQKRQATTLPVRLQAYERLSLLLERVALPGLIMRVRTPEMNAASLKLALLMGIQQEYEHNITQQIYVSDQLWEILKATRSDLFEFIDVVAEKVDKKAPGQELAAALLSLHQQREADPILTAQAAIRREAATLF